MRCNHLRADRQAVDETDRHTDRRMPRPDVSSQLRRRGPSGGSGGRSSGGEPGDVTEGVVRGQALSPSPLWSCSSWLSMGETGQSSG